MWRLLLRAWLIQHDFSDRYWPFTASQATNLSVSYVESRPSGELTGDREVPFAASRDALFSVSYVESRPSGSANRRPRSAQLGLPCPHSTSHAEDISSDSMRLLFTVRYLEFTVLTEVRAQLFTCDLFLELDKQPTVPHFDLFYPLVKGLPEATGLAELLYEIDILCIS